MLENTLLLEVLVWGEAFSHSEFTKTHLRTPQGILKMNNSPKEGKSVII